MQLTEEIIKLSIKNFWTHFNNKLKSGLFVSKNVSEMFEKLLNYTINSVYSVCDIKSDQKDVDERMQTELRQKFSEIDSKYLRKTSEIKSLIEKARRDSIRLYSERMSEFMSKNSSRNRREVETMSATFKSDALQNNAKILNAIKSDVNTELFDHLLEENIKAVELKMDYDEQVFLKKCPQEEPKIEEEKKLSVDSSLALHFGRLYLFAGVFDGIKFSPVLNDNQNSFRPNCIAISDQILCGYEAKEFWDNYQQLGESIDKDFDIKKFLFKRKDELSIEELNSYPFQLIEENNCLKVEVKNDSMNYNFSIESLIALQVLDIKSDAEKQLSTTTLMSCSPSCE